MIRQWTRMHRFQIHVKDRTIVKVGIQLVFGYFSCLRFYRKIYHCKYFGVLRCVDTYLPTKFQLDRLINNGDPILDRKKWKTHMHTPQTHTQTLQHTHIHTHKHTITQTEIDTLPIYLIGSSKKKISPCQVL